MPKKGSKAYSKMLEQTAAWRIPRRAEIRAKENERHRRNKEKAFTILGNKCSNPHCRWMNEDGSLGCTDSRCLQIDHINGDGNKERKNGMGARTHVLYLRIVKGVNAERYQLLCANCNWKKRY